MQSEQCASVKLRAGNHLAFCTEVPVTPAGGLAIGALVSEIRLSVAPLVLSARRRPY
jgi:hypothetical protein